MAPRGLTPYNPMRSLFSGDPLQEFRREMDRLFDDVFRGSGMQPFSGPQRGSFGAPRVDVHETENELCVTADLPGVKQNELDVRIDGDVLTISGERRNENDDKQANWHVMERSYGTFSRSVQLPFAPDAQKVEAHFTDGVLKITMPTEGRTQRARRIEIRSGGESPQLSGGEQGAGSWQGGGTGVGTSQQGSGYPASGSTMLQGDRTSAPMQQSSGGGSSQSVGGAQQSAGIGTPAGQQSAGSTSRKGDEPKGNLPG